MFIPSPIRTRFTVGPSFLGSVKGRSSSGSAKGRSISSSAQGRRAKAWHSLVSILGFSVIACLAAACSDDDPAPQTKPSGSVAIVDASVRDLPGDGTEPTPESDTDTRQRDPIGPERLNDEIDGIQDNLANPDGQNASAPDASTGSAADAGSD